MSQAVSLRVEAKLLQQRPWPLCQRPRWRGRCQAPSWPLGARVCPRRPAVGAAAAWR